LALYSLNQHGLEKIGEADNETFVPVHHMQCGRKADVPENDNSGRLGADKIPTGKDRSSSSKPGAF
jgi:hypothetical protein